MMRNLIWMVGLLVACKNKSAPAEGTQGAAAPVAAPAAAILQPAPPASASAVSAAKQHVVAPNGVMAPTVDTGTAMTPAVKENAPPRALTAQEKFRDRQERLSRTSRGAAIAAKLQVAKGHAATAESTPATAATKQH